MDYLYASASYIKNFFHLYTEQWLLLEWPEENGSHSVVSNKHITTPPPHAVGITVDVKLGRKEYRGIVIAVGEECCTIPAYGCL